MKIQVLVDNPDSWMLPYAKELISNLKKQGHQCYLLFSHKHIEKGDILCLLSCEKIFKQLHYNEYNLVVHESDLPKGKGWSPITWQILEGKNTIPVTLFEAEKAVDAGKIYGQKIIELDGTELLPEIKHKQGVATQELILEFVSNFKSISGVDQSGMSTFYRRRGPSDSELDPYRTIAEQFDLIRVCDNEKYPAHFRFRNKLYKIKIYSEDD